jgi:hypothetical protein
MMQWAGGVLLSNLLCAHPTFLPSKSVVELGCGSALLSCVASALGCKSVVATDGQSSVLSLAALNLSQPSSRAAAAPTTALLRSLGPGLRTALFSRLGPGTVLAPHDGWAELSNHVLRCHLALSIPAAPPGCSGVAVEGLAQPHSQGSVLCFDDSRVHSGFNTSPTQERTVLIIDMARPAGVRPGRATEGATRELADFMAYFN